MSLFSSIKEKIPEKIKKDPIWKTSSQTQQPAYIMAVGYDGTRVKCYEP